MRMRFSIAVATALLCLPCSAQVPLDLTYWFDSGEPVTVRAQDGESSMEVDASSLDIGVHTLFMMAKGANGLSSARSAFFVKTANPASFAAKGLVSVNGENASVVPVMPSGGGAAFEFDATGLPLGVHSLTTTLVSEKGELSDFVTAFFLRVPTHREIGSMEAFYSIDDGGAVRMPLSGDWPLYRLDIDASALSTGIHSVSFFLASPLGMSTTPVRSWFVKVPAGGDGIREYRYWINDREEEAVVCKTETTGLPFSLVKMMDVPLTPFRSSSYELKMEADGPAVYGVHDLNFFAFDNDFRVVSFSAPFTESRIRKRVETTSTLKGDGVPVRLDRFAGEEIKWFAADAALGDSLVVRLSRAATIDVFSPSGERVYSAKGNEAVHESGFYARETGRYLVGVHDCVREGSSPELIYTHIDKYAVIDRSPRQTAEGSMFVLTISGNGFDHLKEVRLSSDAKEFAASRIIKEGKGRAMCLFDLSDAPLGPYRLTADYDDGEERASVEVPEALKVVAPREGEIRVSAARSVFGTTLNDVLIKVTNTGNIPYWGVPFNIAAEADGTETIKMNFKDFIPALADAGPEGWTMYFTENLLGTGRRGGYLPMMIPYLGPGETREYTIVYQMPLRTHIPTYAWTGRPWSDEFREIISLAEEGKPAVPEDVNYVSASLVNMLVQLDEYNKNHGQTSDGPMRAPAAPVDISDIATASQAVQALGEYLGADMGTLNNATVAAQLAVATGNTMGSLINGLRLQSLDARLDAYGIDLSDGTYSILADYRSDLVNSMPSPGTILSCSGWDIWGMVLDRWLRQRGEIPNPMPQAADIVQMTPCDPNDITGYQDPCGGRYVGIGVTTMPYTIEFENDPELATAPAHVIKVTDVLDPEVFDLSSFAMREIRIGEKTLKLDGGADFVRTIDMRPEINAVAEVSLTLDRASGEASWTFVSLDPMTLDPAEEMIQGILPVNTDGEGCGKILFDIDLKAGLRNAAAFSNKASIVFDSNDAIDTPVWENTTDYERPSARITGVGTADRKTFSFDIEASDSGAGIWNYELYFRPKDSTAFELVRSAVPADETSFVSDKELDGYFVIVAVDGAGNRQIESVDAILWGDADTNGVVDSNDVVIIRNFFVGSSGSIDRIAAEVTSDYIIDAQDALVTRNIFLNAELNKHARTRKYSKKK